MMGRVLVVAALALALLSCDANGRTTTPPPLNAGPSSPASSPAITTRPPGTPALACAVSPDSTYNANGYVLDGKSGGGIFIYPAAGRIFKANNPENFLVFLDPLPRIPPSPLIIHGTNRTSGTRAVFENTRHLSEYGIEWGTNYFFPDAGCWELRVADRDEQGTIVVFVTP